MHATNIASLEPNRRTLILGRRSIQTALLTQFLEVALGCDCRVTEKILDRELSRLHRSSLVLLDCSNLAKEALIADLERFSAVAEPPLLACFNVPDLDSHEFLLEWPVVTGIFFEDASQELLPKGVEVMFGGDYWFPRRLLHRHLEKHRNPSNKPCHSISVLTAKEQQILRLIATGATNEKIAQKLFISAHTVKTHLYNIFKKINVSNRLQAANWIKACDQDTDFKHA